MNKTCSICGEIKSISHFETGRKCCRQCKNKKDTDRDKSHRIVQIKSEFESKITPVQQLVNNLANVFFEQLSDSDKIDKILAISQEVCNFAIDIKSGDVRLTFQLHVNAPTQKYLMHVFKENGDLRKAKAYLNDPDVNEFENHFELPAESLSRDDIENIERATNFVRTIYHVLVDERQSEHDSKFSNGDTLHIERPSVSFNPALSSVVVSKNPLRLTRHQFMAAIGDLEIANHMTFMMYKEHGIYDKFKKMLIIE